MACVVLGPPEVIVAVAETFVSGEMVRVLREAGAL